MGFLSGRSPRAPSFGHRLLLRKISQQKREVLFGDGDQGSPLTALQFVD
jgi:hypothetical protein